MQGATPLGDAEGLPRPDGDVAWNIGRDELEGSVAGIMR